MLSVPPSPLELSLWLLWLCRCSRPGHTRRFARRDRYVCRDLSTRSAAYRADYIIRRAVLSRFLGSSRLRCDEALVKSTPAWPCSHAGARPRRSCERDAGVRSEPGLLLGRAENLQAHCAEHVLPYFAAMASVYRGWALSLLGRTDQGLALVTEGLAAYRATGALLYVPKLLLLLADCYRNAGEPKEGLKYLDEAAGLIEGTEIRGVEADIYRRRGEFLLVVGDRGAAEANFLQALDVARRQNAKLFELQAASVLARLWREQGKRTEARDLLGPILQLVHRRFRCAGHEGREGTAGRVIMTAGSGRRFQFRLTPCG